LPPELLTSLQCVQIVDSVFMSAREELDTLSHPFMHACNEKVLTIG